MDNYVPVDAPRIEGVPLLLATQEARKADPELDALLSQIARENTPPCIIQTRAKYFPNLVPSRFNTSPVWILWLPDELSDEIGLHQGFPAACEAESRDLRECAVAFDWPMRNKTVRAMEHGVVPSLIEAGIWPDRRAVPLVIVLLTPSRLSLDAVWLDELTVTDLQIRGLRCGDILQRYSDMELEEAAKEAALHGNTRDTDDAGRPLIWLDTYEHRWDE